ncbi:MAG: hypothetical protein K2I67_03200 [Malacoplasma sp.]|nr:hypothetical protein [Malacoplasma sp.]
MTKKRILVISSIGAAAVIAGVSPAIALTANTQSSTIDGFSTVNPKEPTTIPTNPTDPNNPNNPTDSSKPTNPVNPSEKVYATSPSEDVFTPQLTMYTLNDSSLNTWLKNYFSNNSLDTYKSYLQSGSEYNNVNITYVQNSASLATNSFQLDVAPIDGAVWQSTENNNEKRTITIKIDKSVKIPDATVPINTKNSSFNVTIKDKNIKTDSDLNQWLSNYFKTSYKLTDFTPTTADYVFKNVSLSYVENSADLVNKSFKVKATPLVDHAWASNAFYKNSIVDSFDMDILIGNIIDTNKIISLPERWSNSIVMNSIYREFSNRNYLDWGMLGFFFDPTYLNYNVSLIPEYRKKFDAQKDQNEWYFYRQGLRELAKYYPVEQAYWDAIRYDKVERVSGGIALDYSILCYPKQGYFWEDGTNGNKWVQMRLFVSSEWDVGKSWVLGKTYDLTEMKRYNAENENTPLPTWSWVTNKLLSVKNDIVLNGTFEENKKIVEKIIMDDLEKNFPDYYIQVTDLQSASPNEPQDVKGNWKYKIRFILKTDRFAISDFIDGYIFSDGWSVYN